MKISILIPVYKCEGFVEKCCHSVFSQALDDIEFIFVDDCSPDNSVSVIKDVLAKYPNRQQDTKIVSLSENHGVAFVRNLLVQEASGDYLLFVDSDDWLEADAVKILYEKARDTNADIISFDFYCDNRNRTTQRLFRYKTMQDCLRDVIGNNWGVVWRFMFKRTLVTANSISFPVGLQGGEDYVFCVRCFLSSKTIATVHTPLYHYVTYNSSSLITNRNIDSISDQFKATEIVERLLRDKGILSLYKGALDDRKAYVTTSFESFFRAKWGKLIYARYRRKYRLYLLKIRILYQMLVNGK